MKIYRTYEDLPKIKLPLGQEVFISDSTIRDGSQMPGIVMKKKHKTEIYEYLHKIGIEKLETFVYNERDREAAKEMLDRGYEFPEVTGWARANPKDIDFVLSMDGIKETGILMSVSDSHVIDKMGLKSREEAEKKYTDALQYAVDHGLRTRAHIEDMTRADNEGFVFPLISKLLEIDPDCIIRLCDTVGYGVPFPEVDEPYGIPHIVKRLREIGTKNIETHVHDDFGMSVACSLAGYWYGANWSSLTFLGIGERAGNAELEKVVLFLIQRVEGFQKYDLTSITEFARFMEREIGIRVPRNKSVVGKNIFAHESGIHTAGIIKNPFTYEPYPPELVGGKRELMIGDSSGLEVIRYKVEETLNELMHVATKVEKTDPRVKAIQADIQKLYNEEKRISAISDEELKKFVEKYFMLESIIEEHSANMHSEKGKLNTPKKNISAQRNPIHPQVMYRYTRAEIEIVEFQGEKFSRDYELERTIQKNNLLDFPPKWYELSPSAKLKHYSYDIALAMWNAIEYHHKYSWESLIEDYGIPKEYVEEWKKISKKAD